MTGKDSSLEIPLSHSQKIMGGRPGFKTKYTAYVTPDGVLKSLDATLFIDCGSSSNDAYGYASFCLNDFRACGSGPYNIENLRWKCQLIQTNKQPITYMRAPGEMAPLYRFVIPYKSKEGIVMFNPILMNLTFFISISYFLNSSWEISKIKLFDFIFFEIP